MYEKDGQWYFKVTINGREIEFGPYETYILAKSAQEVVEMNVKSVEE